jgi:alkaline phosphatase D
MDGTQHDERSSLSVEGKTAREPGPSLSRRTILAVPAAVGLGAIADRCGGRLADACSAGRAPAFVRLAAGRPATPSGVASGDVTDDSAIIWSRTDRPARMLLEWSTTSDFANIRRVRGPLALPTSNFTARIDLRKLPVGQEIFYRVTFVDLTDPNNTSEPLAGHLRLGPGTTRRDVTFLWGGDTAGQGWGINPEYGGYRCYETMRRVQPDFFLHSGDNIYADGPIQAEVKLADGTIWRNLVLPGKDKVAETLDEFRANYRYNTLDENLRRFYAETAVFAQWDDHEVRNNWFPGQVVPDIDTRYKERSVDLLAAYASRAFLEYQPLRLNPLEPERVYRSYRYGPDVELFLLDERSYRGPNSPNVQPERNAIDDFLGREQLAWLKTALAQSPATWKIMASDMPVSLFVADPLGSEAWANNQPGAPRGRELQLAEILKFIRDKQIRNVVWLTADVHYAAAHFYEPSRGAFADFVPFWEFVAGPLHAGTFGPNKVDPTFGPKVVFNSVPDNQPQNAPPSAGQQFFGVGRVNASSRVLTIELRNTAGQKLYSVELPPAKLLGRRRRVIDRSAGRSRRAPGG